MKFGLIFGDSAVGKMTVGQELSRITGLNLCHNHSTIEPVLEIFNDFNVDAILRMREVIFEEFAKTDKYGLIYTFMWDFDSKFDYELTEKFVNIFKKVNAEIYYVELNAPLEVRLKRNKTENRLINKASKRDVEASESRLIKESFLHRCSSYDGELKFENYLKIDNSNIEAIEVARMIKEKFNL